MSRIRQTCRKDLRGILSEKYINLPDDNLSAQKPEEE